MRHLLTVRLLCLLPFDLSLFNCFENIILPLALLGTIQFHNGYALCIVPLHFDSIGCEDDIIELCVHVQLFY